jgi:hypothetical protein
MENNTSFDFDMPEPLEPRPSGAGLVSGFLGTAKTVLLRPRVFFEAMPVEGGLLGPYFFFVLCTLLFLLVTIVLNVRAGATLDPQFFLAILLAFAMPFVSAALLHFFLNKLLQTKGTFEATFRVVCYASAVYLLAWIPILGFLLQFYEIYLSILGLSVVHRTTMGKALLAVIGVALVILFAVFLGMQAVITP